MTSINLKPLMGASTLTVLICIGFWLYTRWDTQRFVESLPKAPVVQTETTETAPAQQAASPYGATRTTENTVMEDPVRNTGLEDPEDDATEQEIGTAVAVGNRAETADLYAFFEEFLEETAVDTITSGDFTNVAQDASYDQALVAAAFADYNVYLKTDPEYAYQRLEEAFREQYNDDPDVSGFVEAIRKSSEGPLTMNEWVQSTELMMRFFSKTSSPEVLKRFENHFQTVMKELESGTSVIYTVNFIIRE